MRQGQRGQQARDETGDPHGCPGHRPMNPRHRPTRPRNVPEITIDTLHFRIDSLSKPLSGCLMSVHSFKSPPRSSCRHGARAVSKVRRYHNLSSPPGCLRYGTATRPPPCQPIPVWQGLLSPFALDLFCPSSVDGLDAARAVASRARRSGRGIQPCHCVRGGLCRSDRSR